MSYQPLLIPACMSARLTAWLIDLAVTIGLMAAVMIGFTGTADVRTVLLTVSYPQLAAVLAVPVIFHTLLIGATSRTVGLALADLQFIQGEGDGIEWSNAIRRPLAVLTLPVSIALLCVVPLLGEHRRTIGDFISGTRVIESPVPGVKVSYDAWRVFKGLLKPTAPFAFATALVGFLVLKDGGANKDVFLDALVVALIFTLLTTTVIAAVKVRSTRVRLTPTGIMRSGLLVWSNETVRWTDIDFARFRPRRLFHYFELHRKNRQRFKVPLENNAARLMADALTANGIRIEQ